MNKSFLLLSAVLFLFGFLFWYSFLYKPAVSTKIDSLIVATSADFKPLSFKDGDQIVGFDIDIMNEVARRLNLTLEYKDMPFELLVPQLQLGTVHAAAAGMSITPERAQRVIFTQAYLTQDPLVILTLKETPLNPQQLAGKKLIVNQGYTADAYLSKMANIEIMRLPTIADAILALKSGRADGFVTALHSVKPLLEQTGEIFAVSELPDINENIALAISQSYPDLAQKIKTIINDMIADGTVTAIKNKWHLQ